MAAFSGLFTVVEHLICDHKCHAMIRNPNSLLTPLHYASNFGHLCIVQFYVHDLCCDPHVKDKTDTSPLHYAAQNGQLKYLANARPALAVSLLYNDVKHLPINFACFGGHLEIVKFLKGMNDIRTLDIYGQSCLHSAAIEGHLSIAQFLIDECSFDPAAKDFCNVTPLHLASWRGHLNVVSYLVCDKHCDPLCEDKARDTPLHWAASEGHLEVVKFLTEKVGCLMPVGEDNNTPLDYAIIYKHQAVQEYLSSYFHPE